METLDPNSYSNSNPNSPPNKRLKTETLTLDSPIRDKGKAPISSISSPLSGDDGYQSPINLPSQNCGICFSDEGKSVRGFIDSCDHYFCFLCIIEWSKIESRCPLCRSRFRNIRRMRKDGSFIGQGSVRVAVRDQIYDAYGEPNDPYAQAKCNVCNGSNDESFLLLCDLCDSPWHTFCVGLGATVPEGDWFCNDCTLLRSEQLDDETDGNGDSPIELKHDDGAASKSGSVSIFDIVSEQEEPKASVNRLLELVSPRKKFSSSTINSDLAKAGCTAGSQASGGNLKHSVEVTESSVRTLRNCRNVQRHISLFRENWNGFRNGYLSFTSESLDSSGKSSKRNVVARCPEGSLQSKASETSCDALPNKDRYNVDKAWKLMNKAKLMKPGKPKCVSKIPHNKASVLKADNVVSKGRPVRTKDIMSPRPGMRNPTEKRSFKLPQKSGPYQVTSATAEASSTSREKYENPSAARLSSSTKAKTPAKGDIYHEKHGLPFMEKLGRGRPVACNDGYACSTSFSSPIGRTSVVSSTESQMRNTSTCYGQKLTNVKSCAASQAEVQISAQADVCHGRAGLPIQQILDGGSSNVFDKHRASACSTSPHGRVTDASNASCVKVSEEVSGFPNEVGAKTSSKISTSDEAKGEIQSLVKLNLKLLTKDKPLGADLFKEIARISTHTILAACGFEHRKIIRSHPTLVCHHGDQIQQLHSWHYEIHFLVIRERLLMLFSRWTNPKIYDDEQSARGLRFCRLGSKGGLKADENEVQTQVSCTLP